MSNSTTTSRGFTLVEMVVSVALFAIVMLVCVSTLLALTAANRKVHALQSVMDNLNVTLDGMVRDIRMGSVYDASAACSSNPGGGPKDCTQGGTQFSYEPYGNGPSGIATVYKFDNNPGDCGQSAVAAGCIVRSKNGGPFQVITSPQVQIQSLQFFLVGASKGCSVTPCDLTQPKVVIEIKGTAPVLNSAAKSTFHIQVTAVQRLLDL